MQAPVGCVLVLSQHRKGQIRSMRNLELAKFDAEKFWHQFLNATATFGTNSQTVIDCDIDGEWWLLFPMGLWVAAAISYRF